MTRLSAIFQSRYFTTVGYALLLSLSPPSVVADESASSGGLADLVDCSDIRIDYQDDPEYSRQERTEQMNDAFYAALNQFDLCQSAQAGGGGGGAGAAGGGGTTAASTESQQEGELRGTEGSVEDQLLAEEAAELLRPSSPSDSLRGTEPVSVPPQADPLDGSDSVVADSEQDRNASKESARAAGSGAAPEDIADADNDDAVARQIRAAAEGEQDPERQKRLWDEYRRYKRDTAATTIQ